MVDAGLRARVERLLRGDDFRPDDLTRLFLYARDRCDGREAVQEIGDFVAHHNERTKGLVTRIARDWFLTTRFVFVDQETLDFSHLPENYLTVLEASFRQLDDDIVFMEKLGKSRKQAGKLMPSLISKFTKNSDETLAFSSEHTSDEFELAKCLSTIVVFKPAFSADRLLKEFSATLKSNALLKQNELAAFEKLQPLISLFAISVMHNCALRFDDDVALRLEASGPTSKLLQICALTPLGKSNLPGRLFSTDLNPKEYCDPELLALSRWECDLEVTPRGLLGKLG